MTNSVRVPSHLVTWIPHTDSVGNPRDQMTQESKENKSYDINIIKCAHVYIIMSIYHFHRFTFARPRNDNYHGPL